MGFNIELRQVTHDAMYNKFCSVPKAKIHICPNVGWVRDFGDPQVYLEPTFNGKNIIPTNNVNWPQLNVPEINQAMADASLLIDKAERAEAWAEIDRMVSEQAPTVNWLWDKSPNIQSANVNAVVDEINGLWDFAYTSID
jgi:peptide/nickel transport system substrate-binding protein